MKRYLRVPVQFVFELAQWFVIGVIQIVFRYPSRMLAIAGHFLVVHWYYWGIVRPKRWCIGQDAWQPQDLHIGIGPPSSDAPVDMARLSEQMNRAKARYEAAKVAFENPTLVAFAESVGDDQPTEVKSICRAWLSDREGFMDSLEIMGLIQQKMPAPDPHVRCVFCHEDIGIVSNMESIREHALTCAQSPAAQEISALRLALSERSIERAEFRRITGRS